MRDITNNEWNELNENQKEHFEETLNKSYSDEEIPTYDDIYFFLEKKKAVGAFKKTDYKEGTYHEPGDTETLWGMVKSELKK